MIANYLRPARPPLAFSDASVSFSCGALEARRLDRQHAALPARRHASAPVDAGEIPAPWQQSGGLVILSIRFYLRFEHPTWENSFDRALRVRDAATEPSSRLPNRSILTARRSFRRHAIYRRKTVQRVRCTVLPAMLHFERTWMPPRPKTRNPRRYARSREVGSRTVRTERNIPAKTDRCRRNAAWSGIAPERKPDPVCGKINGLALLGIPRCIFPKDAEAKPQVAVREFCKTRCPGGSSVPKPRFCCT